MKHTVLLLSLVGWLAAARAEVVYDNTFQGFDNQFYPTQEEFGDEIDLEGTGRTVTKFQCEYFGNFTPTGNEFARVRLYVNDGEGSDLTVGTFGKPQTLLYESGQIRLGYGFNTITLRDLPVTVPERFTWTVKFEGLSGRYLDQAGLVIYNPPTVGSSYNDFWLKTQNQGWQPLIFPNYIPPANFSARVEAGPDTEVSVASEGPLNDGTYRVTLQGPAYRNAVVEASSDSSAWTPVHTLLFTGRQQTWIDHGVQGATARTYRVSFTNQPVLSLRTGIAGEGAMPVHITGTPGNLIEIQASADLAHWTPISTNYLTSMNAKYLDFEWRNYPQTVYRARFIENYPITFVSVSRLPNGYSSITLAGPPGKDCRIEVSHNLTSWTTLDIVTFSFTGGTINYLDPLVPAGSGQNYYRATLVP